MKIIRDLLDEAVGPCPACDATGWRNASRDIPCDECENTGKKLTPEGAELVGFAAKWLSAYFPERTTGTRPTMSTGTERHG